MGKSWTSCEQVVNKSQTSHEQVMISLHNQFGLWSDGVRMGVGVFYEIALISSNTPTPTHPDTVRSNKE